jgi:hypothetical protein
MTTLRDVLLTAIRGAFGQADGAIVRMAYEGFLQFQFTPPTAASCVVFLPDRARSASTRNFRWRR